jgi:hypothetical protein
MERGLPVFRARQAPRQGIGIARDDLSDRLEVTACDGREDVMSRATLEQQRHYVFGNPGAKAGCPSDDAELVRVTLPVYISTGIEEGPDDVHATRAPGEVQGRGVVTRIARVRIGTMLEQQAHRVEVLDGEVQAGAPLGRALVREARIGFQQVAEHGDIAGATGREE